MNTSSLDLFGGNPLMKRLGTVVMAKGAVLKPDSPRTMEACTELGIPHEDMRQKFDTYAMDFFIEIILCVHFRAPEEVYDPKDSSAVKEYKLKHYKSRYNQLVREILAKKREIIRRQRIGEEEEPGENASWRMMGKANSSSQIFYGAGSPKLARPGTEALDRSMLQSFNRTVSVLRTSHGRAEPIDPSVVNPGSMSHRDSVDEKMVQEIDKYNRLKLVKLV
eukprot:TRINITY_DN983_c0_g2_i4.p1 TRINITY_DN983_c0_g2~~TRINITY_DN983_c0_g2_i4.p1  ORF type:complete len:221 (+),score=11.84 TRINITY_DN983_c0_g2_i4:135-797(+)